MPQKKRKKARKKKMHAWVLILEYGCVLLCAVKRDRSTTLNVF